MKHLAFYLLFVPLLIVAQNSSLYAQKVAKAHKTKVQNHLLPDDDPNPPQPLGEAFVGDWEWASGGNVFHLAITRDPAYIFPEYPNEPSSNVIICHFTYASNGIVVDHSLNTGRMPFAAMGIPGNNHQIKMVFYDHGTKGFGYLTLTLPTGNPDVLEWLLTPRETYYRNPADRPAVPFLMPTAMTLTRQ